MNPSEHLSVEKSSSAQAQVHSPPPVEATGDSFPTIAELVRLLLDAKRGGPNDIRLEDKDIAPLLAELELLGRDKALLDQLQAVWALNVPDTKRSYRDYLAGIVY